MRVTDNRTIIVGNEGADTEVVSGRLKVEAQISSAPIGISQAWSSKLRYEDMAAISRGTGITAASGWNQVYTYTGTGYLGSFFLNLDGRDDWAVRLKIDGEELFGSGGILTSDMNANSIYDLGDGGKSLNEAEIAIGLMLGNHDRVLFSCPKGIPIKFSSEIKIYLSRVSGAITKKYRAGLIVIQKDT